MNSSIAVDSMDRAPHITAERLGVLTVLLLRGVRPTMVQHILRCGEQSKSWSSI
jgi:hypothetical protein